MWVTADDVEAYLTAAEAEEEEAAWDAVYDDVECVGGGYRATEQRIGNAAGDGQPRVAPRETLKRIGEISRYGVVEEMCSGLPGDGGNDVGSECCACGGSLRNAPCLYTHLPCHLYQSVSTVAEFRCT